MAKKNNVDPHGDPVVIRRLFWDIETSPIITWNWRSGYNLSIHPGQILSESKIICISYKWENEPVKTLVWDKGDDKDLIRQFLKVYNQADEIIYHNGDRFDMGWLRKQVAKYRLGYVADKTTYDTRTLASRKFYFNSNKLDYLGKFLENKQKLEVHADLWERVCFKQCPKALEEMVEYCERDVELLEKAWRTLTAVAGNSKTHVGVLNGRPKWSCPWDGSVDVSMDKQSVTARGTVQFVMKCADCNRTYKISKRDYEHYLEAKEYGIDNLSE